MMSKLHQFTLAEPPTVKVIESNQVITAEKVSALCA